MKLKHIGGFMLPIILSLTFSCANAQESESEARYLISIVNEIENLKALAQKSADRADGSQRVHFNYSALQHDLEEIQRAIEKHVAEPSRSPRTLNSISANYQEVKTDE